MTCEPAHTSFFSGACPSSLDMTCDPAHTSLLLVFLDNCTILWIQSFTVPFVISLDADMYWVLPLVVHAYCIWLPTFMSFGTIVYMSACCVHVLFISLYILPVLNFPTWG